MDPWFGYGVPTVVLAMGVIGLAYARWMTREFERKYGEWPARRSVLATVPVQRRRG
ncbi:hypothetical protein SAMN07250955_104188 [Arboricoccus pini]|uniref:Heme exporter protein D n=1 Tax=Arboricoccus pini TaxID=1963835 RepID=A0A212QZ81_9PROT|nr:hypothetical protein [Arboricoccus pini]SNB65058.1 hypothetical protein SAMN07250955_104188 [Arboricoccus pini]